MDYATRVEIVEELVERPGRPFSIYDFWRRVLDLAVALVGLLLLLPIALVVAVLIKIDSPGPVFFVQERVGRNRRRRTGGYYGRERRGRSLAGRPFRMYKFRTMYADAEARTGPVWAEENDPRITRVGQFLRRTRLDEIPQLLNILVGDMTLIGPRPERPHFVEQLQQVIPDYTRRLEVKPGLTGLAQVRVGYDTSVDDVKRKVEHDLKYIDHRSLWLDLYISWQTVWVVITGRGAL
jgi:lipopolysaccharide/colanic/teichoic acid biosynthesis glycosyltransferase